MVGWRARSDARAGLSEGARVTGLPRTLDANDTISR
jgi:hypothetical protein